MINPQTNEGLMISGSQDGMQLFFKYATFNLLKFIFMPFLISQGFIKYYDIKK
jgi:hypothetical protein